LFRRTFPLIKLRLANLEDSALYTVQIEFRVADSFKYRFVNGEWRTTPRTEKLPNTPTLYTHSDSPNFGHHWTKDTIQFFKLKLTNNENGKNRDAVYLRSLNKYDPIIHIYKHDRKNVDDKILVFSHSFKETQFVAVTAYQNDMVNNNNTYLLIDINLLFIIIYSRSLNSKSTTIHMLKHSKTLEIMS